MMERILEELVFMRSKLPNGELKILQTSIDDLKHSQDSIKADVSELKKKLLVILLNHKEIQEVITLRKR